MEKFAENLNLGKRVLHRLAISNFGDHPYF